MSDDDEIEREDPCVWAIAERLFEADRKPYDAPTLEAARPCDIEAMCERAEGLIATARHIGLAASDLAGLAEGTHVVVPVADLERVALIAEYDYPGDAPEFCGMLCQLCGGLDGHEPECVLAARLAALLFALAAKVEGERADA